MQAETRYARSGDVSIAYQELEGTGSTDVVFAHGFVGNLEVEAENPRYEAFFERLATARAPDPVRPARHRAVRPCPRGARRSRRGWTTCVP